MKCATRRWSALVIYSLSAQMPLEQGEIVVEGGLGNRGRLISKGA